MEKVSYMLRRKSKIKLESKTERGPESSLQEFPFLYLYFDDFSELQKAARQGAFDIGMLRTYKGIGNYRFKGILADEERFLDFYRNGVIRLKLHDGTMLCRSHEKEYWDMVVHPENHVREPFSDPAIEAAQQEDDKEIEAKVEAIKRRYGM